MKSSKLKIAQLATIGFLLAVLGSGCHNGSTTQLVVVTNPTSTPTPTPTATATTIPDPGPTDRPCPAWGCGPAPIHTVDPEPSPTETIIGGPVGPAPIFPGPIACPAWGCDGPPIIIVADSSGGGVADSVGGDTRDTDLQQANLQSASLSNRAQTIANQFQMSVGAATQLAVLGDKVQMMTAHGQDLSNEDRDAITQSALSIAGLSTDEVNTAFQKSVSGDNSATDALVEKAAKNLGMASSQNLRGQLLNALGVQLQ